MTGGSAVVAGRDPMTRMARALAGLAGWRRLAVAMLFGALAAAALPPTYLVPLLWPAFTGLLWLLDGVERRRQAFLIGWAFGFGYFVAGLYWIAIAFFVDAPRFGMLAPLAVLGLSAYLALFYGLSLLAVQMAGRRGPERVLLLAAAWLVGDWLRSWVLTGFPWNLIGTVWAFSAETLQFAAVAGVWGVTWVTVAAAAAPAVAGERPDAGPWGRWGPAALGLAALVLMAGFGVLRVALAPAVGSATVEGVALRLVQPSIEQAEKWHPELRQQHVVDQMRLTIGPGFDAVSHVIWAETAVPYVLNQEPELRRALARVVPPDGLLITGAPREAREASGPRLWNSLFALDPTGTSVATYDKVKLVPFGEFVPLRSILGLAKLTQGRVDFSPGERRETLALSGLPPFSALICYEVIYPGEVVDRERPPAWLLTITNDAWFGRSTGPYQHFASARVRAVEEGLPVVRVANTGISAVVDSYGRIVTRLGLDEVGTIDAGLPKTAVDRTVFAKLGNWTVLILCLLAVISSVLIRRLA